MSLQISRRIFAGPFVTFSNDESGTPAVVVEAPTPEGEAEAVAEEETAQVEATAEAAVQIAEIQADKEIALAVIEGENRIAENEAIADNINDSLERENAALRAELEECRNTIATLEMTVLSLTPQPSPEPDPPNPNPSSEAEGVQESQPQEPATEAEPPSEPPQKKKRRWI